MITFTQVNKFEYRLAKGKAHFKLFSSKLIIAVNSTGDKTYEWYQLKHKVTWLYLLI